MNAAGANPRRRRVWKYLLSILLASLLSMAGFGWYLTTESFQAVVRRRLVAELESVTGGRVELGSFHTIPFRLRVEVRDLTIHGNEKGGEVPYVHIERVVGEVKIISALGFEFGFHSVILDHPVVHIVFYPDGTTNRPTPRLKSLLKKTPMEQLFRLSIGRLEVRTGKLLWNDRTIPLDFTAEDVSSEMDYSVLHNRYFGKFLLGKIESRLKDYRPMAWMAEAHFSLGPDSIDFGSLKLNSGRSHLEARGSLKSFRKPEIQGSYEAKLDVQEFAAITRSDEPRGGIVELQGRGTWSLETFSTTGQMLLKDFGWRDRAIDLSGVNASGQFAITPQRVTFSKIDARLLGGVATGSVEVTNWSETKPIAEGPRIRREEERGNAQLRIRDVSMGGVAEAISTPALPLRRMNLSALTSGTVDLKWRGSIGKAEANVALDATAPVESGPGELPLNARTHATYQGETGELGVSDFSAGTPASQLQASGTLGRRGLLKLSASTSDFGEWKLLFAAIGRPEEIPAILHGRAAFSGTATGTIPNVIFAGNFQAEDFDYEIPAGPRSPRRQLHWDRFNAGVQLSSRVLSLRRGILQHGDTTVNFDLTAGLVRWQFFNESIFSSRIAVHDAELSDVVPFMGYQLPVQGKANLYLQASGMRGEPQGTGHVEMTGVTIRGETVQNLTSDLRINRQEIRLNNLTVLYNGARVGGSSDYDFASRVFHADMKGANFDVARVTDGRTGRWQMGGKGDFTAHASGTLAEPVINANVRLLDLTANGERQGNFMLQAKTLDHELHLNGHSEGQPGDLTLEGTVDLREGWHSNLDIHFADLQLGALLHPYLQGRLTGPSSASGVVTLQASLRQMQDVSLHGNLSELALDVENMNLHNEGPIEFAISDQALELNAFHLLGESTDLSIHGTAHLSGDRGIELHTHGQGNLKLLESFDPAFTSEGVVALDMDVAGTISTPSVQGHVQITNGAIAYLDLPIAFSGINGSLSFNQNRLQIEALTAHTGGGLVTFGGNAVWINRRLAFDLRLQEKDVRLRYPPGISSTANADLHFAGTSTASLFSGDITLTKLSVMPGFDFGAYLSRSAPLPVTNPTLNRIRLDVHIVTSPELQMQTAVVRLSGDADLHLRGSAAKPVILGRAEVLEGAVSFNGAKYELERGDVTFKNPVITTPELDLQATTHVRDYDITLSLNGEPDKLKLSYRSDPPLPEADIITLLALGRTTTESAQLQESGQSSFTQEASSAIISQALNATVTNRAQRLFGVSRIKIDPEGLNTETTLARGPAVTIEQQVANNLI